MIGAWLHGFACGALLVISTLTLLLLHGRACTPSLRCRASAHVRR